jgi:hypothetical protein
MPDFFVCKAKNSKSIFLQIFSGMAFKACRVSGKQSLMIVPASWFCNRRDIRVPHFEMIEEYYRQVRPQFGWESQTCEKVYFESSECFR